MTTTKGPIYRMVEEEGLRYSVLGDEFANVGKMETAIQTHVKANILLGILPKIQELEQDYILKERYNTECARLLQEDNCKLRAEIESLLQQPPTK